MCLLSYAATCCRCTSYVTPVLELSCTITKQSGRQAFHLPAKLWQYHIMGRCVVYRPAHNNSFELQSCFKCAVAGGHQTTGVRGQSQQGYSPRQTNKRKDLDRTPGMKQRKRRKGKQPQKCCFESSDVHDAAANQAADIMQEVKRKQLE